MSTAFIGNPDEKTSLSTNSVSTRTDSGGATTTQRAESVAIIPPGGAPVKSGA